MDDVSFWKQRGTKRARRIVLFGAIVALALLFLPIPTLILLVCGAIDVGRHNNITAELIERYFTGNGILTWMLSPLNLLADLFAYRNPGVYALADLPPAHQQEVNECVQAFIDNREPLKRHIAATMGNKKRAMLTFKWYNEIQQTDLRIPAFEQPRQFIKTIAVSVFNTRERTSRHFGPLRLTFRVLYNLDPIDSRAVYIEVDGKTHYWIDNPLFIFDDTYFHQSINDEDHIRYCLFMDMVRPNRLPGLFEVAVNVASAVSGSFKRMFYKNWSFIR
jgi:aspartyl/asparaginyl beta-hydroxylase (cupin superfamily)